MFSGVDYCGHHALLLMTRPESAVPPVRTLRRELGSTKRYSQWDVVVLIFTTLRPWRMAWWEEPLVRKI